MSFTLCALSLSLSAPLFVFHVYRSHEGQHELPNYIRGSLTFIRSDWGVQDPQDHTYLTIDPWQRSRHRLLQYLIPITVYTTI